MKLFVKGDDDRKVYLRVVARTRRQLFVKLGYRRQFVLNGKKYTINDVVAESDNSDTTAGLIFGGLIGLLGGPVGVITGSTIGGLIGNTSDNKEKNDVITFNNSKL